MFAVVVLSKRELKRSGLFFVSHEQYKIADHVSMIKGKATNDRHKPLQSLLAYTTNFYVKIIAIHAVPLYNQTQFKRFLLAVRWEMFDGVCEVFNSKCK